MEEKIENIKKYIKKLNTIILNNTTFSLFSKRFVNKQRIDDIICCIEANWPQELKNTNVSYNTELSSLKIYKNFLTCITKKTFISNLLYNINYNEFLKQSSILLQSIDSDAKSIKNNS